MNRFEAREILQCIPLDDLRRLMSGLAGRSLREPPELCAIMSLRTGGCTEDCSFCAQSSSLAGDSCCSDPGTVREYHSRVTSLGISRFSLVANGRGPDGKLLDTVCDYALSSKDLCPLCASLGITGKPVLDKLKDAGITRYHHNLETSRRYFPRVCSTHTWRERFRTAASVKAAGLSLCSGGIIGIGETDEDRIDLAFSLRDLNTDSIALNFFVDTGGSRLAPSVPGPEKLLRITALFRLVNPGAELRVCAGREALGALQKEVFSFGATGLMTGPLLTTAGSDPEMDLALLSESGRPA